MNSESKSNIDPHQHVRANIAFFKQLIASTPVPIVLTTGILDPEPWDMAYASIVSIDSVLSPVPIHQLPLLSSEISGHISFLEQIYFKKNHEKARLPHLVSQKMRQSLTISQTFGNSTESLMDDELHLLVDFNSLDTAPGMPFQHHVHRNLQSLVDIDRKLQSDRFPLDTAGHFPKFLEIRILFPLEFSSIFKELPEAPLNLSEAQIDAIMRDCKLFTALTLNELGLAPYLAFQALTKEPNPFWGEDSCPPTLNQDPHVFSQHLDQWTAICEAQHLKNSLESKIPLPFSNKHSL